MFLENDDFRLSSQLTPFYKWGITSLIVSMNLGLWILTIFVFPGRYWDLYMILIPFFFIVSTLLLLLFANLKDVTVQDESLKVRVKGNYETIPFERIVDVKRFIFYFFRIRYRNNEGQTSSILIMPRVREFALSFGFGKVRSFKMLEERLSKLK